MVNYFFLSNIEKTQQVSEKRDQVFYVVVIEVFYVDYFQFSIMGKFQIHFIGFFFIVVIILLYVSESGFPMIFQGIVVIAIIWF